MLVEVTVHCLITSCIAYSEWAIFGLLTIGGEGGGAKRYPLPKIWHTYPTMMKPGTVVPNLKNIQKVYESRNAPLKFCWHRHFLTQNQQIFAVSRNADILIKISDPEDILYVWSWDQSLVTLAFLWEKLSKLNFIRNWPEKNTFLRGGLSSSLINWNWHDVWSWNFTPE